MLDQSELGNGEGHIRSQPSAKESDRRSKTKSVRPETLRRGLSTEHPRISSDETIVRHHVQARQSNKGLCRATGGRRNGVDDCDEELEDTADAEAGHEKDAATAEFGDDCAVDEDGEDADGGQDDGVLERLADVGHLEEVGAVGDDEHCSGGFVSGIEKGTRDG